jgi:hypothetical protein
MKHTLLRTSVLMVLAFFLTATVFGQSKKNKALAGYTIDNYEVECLGTGSDGTQILKIWGYGKKPERAILQAKRNAVHAVVFKGIYAGQPGCTKRPLVNNPNAEQEHQDYFNAFFDEGGKYLSFVATSGEGVMQSVKVGKQFKVAIGVSVMKDQLRKELENAQIIKGLDHGF